MNQPDRFRVHVTAATHDDVKDGNVATHHAVVAVLAHDDRDAMLVAAQMVACRGFMPTSAVVIGVRI